MIDPAAAVFLYAEDDPDDRLLAELAHRQCGATNPLVFVADGEEALEYLRDPGGRDGAVSGRAGIVLLDLNMPGVDGRDALRTIKADPDLQRTPVIILTTSAASDDIRSSYQAGANAYIVKPVAFVGLVEIFRSLSTFWFGVSSLPDEPTARFRGD